MNYIVFFAVLLIILALAPSVEAGLFGGKKKKEKKEAAGARWLAHRLILSFFAVFLTS